MSILRRIGSWLPLGVVFMQALFVWSGLLSLRDGVIIGLILEIMLWSVLVIRAKPAIRKFRRDRADGVGGWVAAERALSEVVPARVARWILLEVRLWMSLVWWIFRRESRRQRPKTFAYHAGRRPIIIALVAFIAFDVVVLHLVLMLIFGNRPWIWLLAAVDVYGVVWIIGIYASMVTIPHRILRDSIELNNGFRDQLVVPMTAVKVVAQRVKDDSGIKQMAIQRDGSALFSSGPANVAIELDDSASVIRRGEPLAQVPKTLYVTVDTPEEFVQSIRTDRNVRR
ncbi:hypothetical protein [Antrihabitans spumae]|uniref:PH domain-containing protein n=1 Tax=Antrihabitans spumae TaxID=3373370 RepID=A0ABW7KTH4_9NOCA